MQKIQVSKMKTHCLVDSDGQFDPVGEATNSNRIDGGKNLVFLRHLSGCLRLVSERNGGMMLVKQVPWM